MGDSTLIESTLAWDNPEAMNLITGNIPNKRKLVVEVGLAVYCNSHVCTYI